MPGPVPNRAYGVGGTSPGTFRSAKIRAAQQLADAKLQGYLPTGYVSKANRPKIDSNEFFANLVRRAPYNPAKGQTHRVKDYQ
jgi:hypothetical protein